jgi:hypothetical protein
MSRILLLLMCAGIFSIAESYAMNEKIRIKKERKPLQVINSQESNKAAIYKKKKKKENKDSFNDGNKENQINNIQTKHKTQAKTKKPPVKKINEDKISSNSKKNQKIQTPQKSLVQGVTVSKEEVPLEEPKTPEKPKNEEDENLISVFSPLLKDTPTTVEYKYWQKFRLIFILLKYPNLKRCAVLSPKIRKIYREHDTANLFKRVQFNKKTIFQADFLIDPEDEVLDEEGKWEKNLERMKKGLAPIAKKGITHKEDRSLFTNEEIWKKQKLYKIDLQHVTQKDTGLDEDPIVEMTHKLHIGIDLYFILKKDLEDEDIRITHFNLTKKEALSILEKEKDNLSCKAANALHPRGGVSLIDRPSFGKWRIEYWKNRAEEIEKGNFTKTPPKRIKKAPLFPTKELDSDEESDF